MADQNLKTLIQQALQAQKAGSDVAKMATAEIEKDASHPELQAALQEGHDTSAQWAMRIEQAIEEAGSGPSVGNQVLEAHYEVSKKIRQAAPDATSRDLGIVAAGQLALHYWIASFGTVGNYAEKLGMSTVAQNMRTSVEEAKKADAAHTAIAERLLSA